MSYQPFLWFLEGQTFPRTQVEEPVGWKDMSILLERDEKWHGIFPSFSLDQLSFRCQGRELIAQEYEALGTEGQVYLEIQYACDGRNPYETFYKGRLNFSDLEFSDGYELASAPIEGFDITTLLLSREDTPVNILEPQSLDGKPIREYVENRWPLQVPSEQGDSIRKKLVAESSNARNPNDKRENGEWDVSQGFLVRGGTGNETLRWRNWLSMGWNNELYNDFNTAVWGQFSGGTFEVYDDPARNCLGAFASEPDIFFEAVEAGTYRFQICELCGTWETFVITDATIDNGQGIDPNVEGCPNGAPGNLNQRTDQFCEVRARLIFEVAGGSSITLYDSGVVSNDFQQTQIFTTSLNVGLVDDPNIPPGTVPPDENAFTLIEDIGGKATRQFCIEDIDISLELEAGDLIRFYWDFETVGVYNRPGALTDHCAYAINRVFWNQDDWYIQEQFGELCPDPYELQVANPLAPRVCIIKNRTPPCCLVIEADTFVKLPEGTTLPLYPPHETMDRIVQAISEGRADFRSSFLQRQDSSPYSGIEGCGARWCLSSGLLVRGFPLTAEDVPESGQTCGIEQEPEDSTTPVGSFFLSLLDAFKGFDGLACIGLGIEFTPQGRAVVRMEERSYFYQDSSVILEIDASDPVLRDLSRKVDKSRVFSEVELGFEKWQDEVENGLDEFNTKRRFTLPLATKNNLLSALSPFVGSGYTLELTRRKNFRISGSQDDDYDNETFVAVVDAISPSGEATLEAGAPGGRFLLRPDKVRNWRIRPREALRRWMGWLAQGIAPYSALASRPLRFVGGEGNFRAGGFTDPNPAGCSFGLDTEENANALITETYHQPYIAPETIQLTHPVKASEFATIAANPRGVIRLDYGGSYEDCYIQTLSYNPTKGEAEFTLIPSLTSQSYGPS